MAPKLTLAKGRDDAQEVRRLTLVIQSAQKCLEEMRRGDALKILKTAFPQSRANGTGDKNDGAA